MRHARWRRNLAALGGLWIGLTGVTAAGTPGAPSSLSDRPLASRTVRAVPPSRP
jgi:hypothetical protein